MLFRSLPDEEEMEALAAAARAAVELTRNEYDLSDDDLDITDEDEDVDFEEFEDLVAAARRAVDEMQTKELTSNWSKFTVAELREALRDRGLPTTGKKADLVALLEESDLDLQKDAEDDDEGVPLDFFASADGMFTNDDDDLDAESDDGEILLFDSDDDSDEETIELELPDWSIYTLAQLRAELKSRNLPTTGKKSDLVTRLEEDDFEAILGNVEPHDFEVDLDGDDTYNGDYEEETETQKDFTTMTVAELKEELKSRGLRVSGKKQELIDRLTSASAEA